jgi:CBS domain-containing protein
MAPVDAAERRRNMTRVVRDAMTANPRTARLGMTVREVARMMEAEDVGSIPVVSSDGILAGVITDRDIVLRVVAAGRDPEATIVDEVATSEVVPPTRMSRSTRHWCRWLTARCAGFP